MKLLSKLILYLLLLIFLDMFISSAIKTGETVNIALALSLSLAIIVYLISRSLKIRIFKYPMIYLGIVLFPLVLVSPILIIISVAIVLRSKAGKVLIYNTKIMFATVLSLITKGEDDG